MRFFSFISDPHSEVNSLREAVKRARGILRQFRPDAAQHKRPGIARITMLKPQLPCEIPEALLVHEPIRHITVRMPAPLSRQSLQNKWRNFQESFPGMEIGCTVTIRDLDGGRKSWGITSMVDVSKSSLRLKIFSYKSPMNAEHFRNAMNAIIDACELPWLIVEQGGNTIVHNRQTGIEVCIFKQAHPIECDVAFPIVGPLTGESLVWGFMHSEGFSCREFEWRLFQREGYKNRPKELIERFFGKKYEVLSCEFTLAASVRSIDELDSIQEFLARSHANAHIDFRLGTFRTRTGKSCNCVIETSGDGHRILVQSEDSEVQDEASAAFGLDFYETEI